jgi:hypothetical protein
MGITKAFKILAGKTEGRNYSEGLGVDDRKILKLILIKTIGGVHWTYLAQARDRWQVLVDMETNFRVP